MNNDNFYFDAFKELSFLIKDSDCLNGCICQLEETTSAYTSAIRSMKKNGENVEDFQYKRNVLSVVLKELKRVKSLNK